MAAVLAFGTLTGCNNNSESGGFDKSKRIFSSILLAAVGVFLAAAVLFLFVLYDYFSGVSRSQLRTETELAAKAVSDEGADFLMDCELTITA